MAPAIEDEGWANNTSSTVGGNDKWNQTTSSMAWSGTSSQKYGWGPEQKVGAHEAPPGQVSANEPSRVNFNSEKSEAQFHEDGESRILQTDQESVAQRAEKRAHIREEIINQGGKIRSRGPVTGEGIVFSDSNWFIGAVAILCFLNMVVVGLEVDNNPDCDQGWLECDISKRGDWYIVENFFTLAMLIEMVLRIVSGPRRYFCGDILQGDCGLDFINCVDFGIVVLRCIDTWILAPLNVQNVIKIISCFRVLHISEPVRRAHTMRTFRELWMILHGIWHAIRVVFWTLVVLFLFLYVGAIIMCDQVTKQSNPALYDYSKSAWAEKPWTADDYWGTVPRSLLSMLQIVTLDHWASTLVRPLVVRNPAFMFFFIPFMTVTVLSLLNVIVAIIVESTIASAAVNEEKMAREDNKKHEAIMHSLKDIFIDADTDGGGELDRQELERAWTQSHVRDRMKVLQLDYSDLLMLFELLDGGETGSGTGSISVERFFRGCTRLRGLAMSSDLHHMSIDFNRCVAWCGELVAEHRTCNDRLSDLLADVEGLDRDVVKGNKDYMDPVLMNRRKRYQRKRMEKGYHDLYQRDENESQGSWASEDEVHSHTESAHEMERHASKDKFHSRQSHHVPAEGKINPFGDKSGHALYTVPEQVPQARRPHGSHD